MGFFSLAIHAIIETMHNEHGVRHDDFQQYREYCGRRLSRLRHNNAVRKDLVHSSAYVAGEKKKRNAYCPRDTPEDPSHENVLLVVLVDAERSWAHFSELKALLIEQLPQNHEKAKSTPGSIRQHALRRLRRAKQAAVHLVDLCKRFCDDRTQLEAKLYLSWIHGNLALETSSWQKACEEFQGAIDSCERLSQSHDDLQARDLFSGRAKNDLAPLLKFCQYEMRQAGIEVTNTTAYEKGGCQRTALNPEESIQFRDQTIIVESKAVKVLLLKAESLKTESLWSSGDDEQLSLLLSTYEDALRIIFGDLEKYRDMKNGPAVEAKREELLLLSGYCKNEKLRVSMEGHELAISQTEEGADLAHLYDALLRDAKAVCLLPGPDEDDFFLEANANVLRLRAFRAFYTGMLYASLDRFSEALALLDQSKQLAERAAEEIAACEMKNGEKKIDDLDNLVMKITGSVVRLEAQAYLGLKTQVRGDLMSNLDMFAPNYTFAEVGPITCSSTLTVYDTAWIEVSQFPCEMQGYVDSKKPNGSRFTGWFGS